MKKRLFSFAIIGLVALTVASYSPVFTSAFTNLDDHALVYENPTITSLAPHHLAVMFSQAYFGLYHPLVLVSYAIEYQLFGFDPLAFHTDNLLLHVANTLLVLLLFMKFSRNRWAALLVAGLFALHPLHVESVAWVSERKDVLYAFFYLLSLAAYLRFRGTGARRWYIAALLLFACSLLSKPMAVTLPAVLLLIEYLQGQRIDRRVLGAAAPFFAVSIAAAAATVLTHYAFQGVAASSIIAGALKNVLSASHQFLFYPFKAIYPAGLSAIYPSSIPASGIVPLPVLLSVPGVVLAAAAVWYFGRVRRWLVFGALWYAVSILPAINLIPSGLNVPADRYTYLPLLGLFFIFAEMAAAFRRPAAAAAACAVLLAACAAGTHERSKIWTDSVTLYTSIIAACPQEAIAYNNRGTVLCAAKKYDAALRDFAKAIEISPRYSDPYINSANIYADRGDDRAALERYDRGISVKQDNPYAYYCRATFFRGRGRTAEALADFNRCIDISSPIYLYYPKAYSNRGVLHFDKGDYESALRDFSRAIAIDARFYQAWVNRGNLFARINRFPEALRDLDIGVRLDPCRKEARFARANVLGCLQRYAEAVDEYTAALSIDPGYLAALGGRAAAYAYLGRYDEAWRDVNAARKAGGTVSPDLIKMIADRSGRNE